MTSRVKRIILVVDDSSEILKVLSRNLKSRFDLVLTAASREEAKTKLNEYEVTYLICDYNFGEEQPKGTELIPELRRENPSIQIAVLFTGDDLEEIRLPPDVDAALSKSCDFKLILEALQD